MPKQQPTPSPDPAPKKDPEPRDAKAEARKLEQQTRERAAGYQHRALFADERGREGYDPLDRS